MNKWLLLILVITCPWTVRASLGTPHPRETGQMPSRVQPPARQAGEGLKKQDNVSEPLRNISPLDSINGLEPQRDPSPVPSLARRVIDKLARQQQEKHHLPRNAAFYFVSFSIPEEGLTRMLYETRQYGIPATLRGLVNNDLRQTVDALGRLVQDGATQGIQIDPTLFSRYGIESVPALIVQCDKGVDVIHGNLRLSQALQKMATQGDCATLVHQLLVRGGRHG